jgi:hypothetical protein
MKSKTDMDKIVRQNVAVVRLAEKQKVDSLTFDVLVVGNAFWHVTQTGNERLMIEDIYDKDKYECDMDKDGVFEDFSKSSPLRSVFYDYCYSENRSSKAVSDDEISSIKERIGDLRKEFVLQQTVKRPEQLRDLKTRWHERVKSEIERSVISTLGEEDAKVPIEFDLNKLSFISKFVLYQWGAARYYSEIYNMSLLVGGVWPKVSATEVFQRVSKSVRKHEGDIGRYFAWYSESKGVTEDEINRIYLPWESDVGVIPDNDKVYDDRDRLVNALYPEAFYEMTKDSAEVWKHVHKLTRDVVNEIAMSKLQAAGGY